ncbi:TetR/AcrR family transcriptional regulator [Streptomyces daghestanicus]|uniref:TetR family transcriptional regulator n=1 Tax=Streptomyces daghestanicus TaxID=66885 RepID=A0ABQ3PUY4_9ACTN|nr:TetR/AcrR family transcriptional regulator [Streptomyces daghestanicus]GGU41685.1 TetR family transcriptional regulator [Streptomyces daghestanicus]GHI28840.1 TetR family transcriptional regulator [Streptomyces daghestanicus]
MNTSRQSAGNAPAAPRAEPAPSRPRGTGRSLTRRGELLAIGRTLFSDTFCDALPMDDIARQAGAAKGLISYSFHSKRGCCLAIVQDSVAGLVASAVSGLGLPPAGRVHRTVDGCLRYAERNQAAYRTIVTGGVGFDAEAHAIRDQVREVIVTTLAEGVYGRADVSTPARTALLPWVCGVEGATRDWIGRPGLTRAARCDPLVKTLGGTLRAVAVLDPAHPAPAPARRDA